MEGLRERRVLVTRAQGQASVLAELLRAEGAVPVLLPVIEMVEPESWAQLDGALAEPEGFDWLVFSSANAVRVFAERAGRAWDRSGKTRIAVIGPATARAVEEHLGRGADLVPGRYVAEGLLEALAPLAAERSVLLVRAAVARDVLPEGLRAAGARVTVADAYRTVVPEASVAAVRAMAAPDAVMFTSASTVVNLMGLLARAGVRLPEGVVLASIGPVTSRALRESGLEPTVEARESTIPSLVEALVGVFVGGG